MAARLTESQAKAIMQKAGFEPLAPYQNSSTPWPSRCIRCARESSPTFNAVQQGRSTCKYCSGNAIDEQEALSIINKAGLAPLEKFRKSHSPWKCRCQKCGSVVSPSLKTVKRHGRGCKVCSNAEKIKKLRFNEADAIRIMNGAGLEPMESFISGSTPWKSRCKTCKKIVTPRLSVVKSKKSGCAYCAGVKIDEDDALLVFERNHLLPIEPYQGNKHPWKSIHTPCGKEVSPTYQALSRGQGPCKYCARKAVHPEDAARLFRQNNLEPLEPYSGDSKKPWKSIHIPCGNEVSPTYNMIQRQETIGCSNCSTASRFFDSEIAYQLFMDKGFQPLVPYPGSNKPWKSIHLVCGSEAEPSYGKIRDGRTGCRVCSGTVAISQKRAFTVYREAGLEPQEEFKGPHHPWKSIHIKCGRLVSPRWTGIISGQGGCAYCSGNKVDIKEVKKLIKENELELLSPFEKSDKPLNAIHIPCGNKVSPTYSALRSGQRPCKVCSKNMVTESEAISLLRKNNYTPLESFPGGSNSWLCVHETCGSKVQVRTTHLRKGYVGCRFCSGTMPITPKEADEKFLSMGFKPLEPFINSRTPRKSIHLVCGKEVSPSWSTFRTGGGGCRYCSTALVNLNLPAYFYLITHRKLNAHKVGISGYQATVNRLESHSKHGWTKYKTLSLATGEEAYDLEAKVLDWLRNDRLLGPYLNPELMPQGGYTETVDAEAIDLSVIWQKVLEIKAMGLNQFIQR